MATITKAISANGIKNGAAQIRMAAGRFQNVDTDAFRNLTDNTAILDEPALADIQNMADDRFDESRYYSGDAIT